MRKHLHLVGLTLLMLVLMDVAVAIGLGVGAKIGGPFDSLVRYFDYGRSVPGKQQAWLDAPNTPGNLYDVAWRNEIIAASAQTFAEEPPSEPVIRTYGMSFVNEMFRAAQKVDGSLKVDAHAGPAAAPNFVFSTYQDDHANRRAGDVAVLGILSSSLHGTRSFSNAVWLFEQPAPFTSPLYELDAGALTRIEPVIGSNAEHRALFEDRELAKRWQKQLRTKDDVYHPSLDRWTLADHSPFLRLCRRYAASYVLGNRETDLIGTPRKPNEETFDLLRAMITEFGATARADGVTPFVVLIQTQGPYPSLGDELGPTLEADGIEYLNTANIHPADDPSGFVADGHFTPAVNRSLGQALAIRMGSGQ